MWTKARALAVRIVGAALGLSILFAGLGLANGLGYEALDTEVTDRGTATVVTCRDEGHVDGLTIGDLWSCELDVRWDSGRTRRAVGEPTQFSAADTGREVEVVERQISRGKTAETRAEVYRADFEPRSLLFYLAVMIVPVFVGVLITLVCAVKAWQVLQGGNSRQ